MACWLLLVLLLLLLLRLLLAPNVRPVEIARSVCRNEQAYFSLNKRVDSFYTCFYADNNKTEPRNVIARVERGER